MSSKLQHPCPQAYVTQRFSTSHPGLDLAKGPGTPILAAHDGVVTVASWDTQGYGNRIDLTGSEVMTRYGHLKGFACQVGEQVRAGQVIGYMGNTGNVVAIHGDGTHLHWEVIPLPRDWSSAALGRVDPGPYLSNGGEAVTRSVLGIQVQNCSALLSEAGAWVLADAARGGVTHAVLIDPDVLGRDPWPGVVSQGRLWFQGDADKKLISQGAAGARLYVEMCKPRWAKCPWMHSWQAPCEPDTGNAEDTNDLDPMKRLAEFSTELVRLGHSLGVRIAVGVFSTGCPAGPKANPLPAIREKWRIFGPACAEADALALHEYGMDTMEYTAENEWHIGHYRRGVTYLREAGYRVPPIWITEHGIDRAGNGQTDGWRVKLGGDEAEAIRQFAQRDADYAADPLVVTVTPFTWLDHNWPSFTITPGLSKRMMEQRLACGAQPTTVSEPVTPPASTGHGLINGDFEGRFGYSGGVKELYVAEGWEPFYVDKPTCRYNDAQPHYDYRPEYKRAGEEAVGPKRAVSGHSQQWFTTYAGHRAGIRQQVSRALDMVTNRERDIAPGDVVQFLADMQSWHDNKGGDPRISKDGQYIKRVGIDPTGGTDWQAPTVVWSEDNLTNDQWVLVSVEAVAKAPTVTVFVYGEPVWAFRDNNCYVDNAEVCVIGATLPAGASDKEINTRLAHYGQQFITPLNTDTALWKAAQKEVPGCMPATDELRLDNYVFQAFYAPGDPSVQHWFRFVNGDWGTYVHWTRAN